MAINELWVPEKSDHVHHTPTDPTELGVLSQLIVLLTLFHQILTSSSIILFITQVELHGKVLT